MDIIKQYLKEELQWSMLKLEHPKPSDFYLSAWQKGESCIPLLIVRSLLFLASLGATLFSMVVNFIEGHFYCWYIHLTHWDLAVLNLTTGFSVAISARVFLYGPISAEPHLPWYVKIFWILYNISNPLAYNITLFYFYLFYKGELQKEIYQGLDTVTYGGNSVIMLLLLISSSHRSRLLHFYHPVVLAIFWVIFSDIFYVFGGTDDKGNRYIYSVINWSKPVATLVFVISSMCGVIALHLATVGMALLRDKLAEYVLS